MVKKSTKITIAQLYPKQMNVYGDRGNIITLQYRLQQRGYTVEYVPLDSLHGVSRIKPDIILGGGGQDSNQGLVQEDLAIHAQELKTLCQDGAVGLMICGMYQMLGHNFTLLNGVEAPGIGIFDMETRANDTRLIGNVVIKTKFGKMVGFENHSGRTYLGHGVKPLGTVLLGAGNNGEDGSEGAEYNNMFGSYMHGPLLAKSPKLADELIKRALIGRGLDSDLIPLDDSIEQQAAAIAMKRPR